MEALVLAPIIAGVLFLDLVRGWPCCKWLARQFSLRLRLQRAYEKERAAELVRLEPLARFVEVLLAGAGAQAFVSAIREATNNHDDTKADGALIDLMLKKGLQELSVAGVMDILIYRPNELVAVAETVHQSGSCKWDWAIDRAIQLRFHKDPSRIVKEHWGHIVATLNEAQTKDPRKEADDDGTDRKEN